MLIIWYTLATCRHRSTTLNVAGKNDLYHDNPKLPVYCRTADRLDTRDIVNALLDPELEDSKVCSMQPVNVESNAVFIVDLGKLKSMKDLYCDDMGSWQYNGVYHTWLEVDELGFISTLGKQKPLQPAPDTYYITKKYFVHKSSSDLKKIVAILSGKSPNQVCIAPPPSPSSSPWQLSDIIACDLLPPILIVFIPLSYNEHVCAYMRTKSSQAICNVAAQLTAAHNIQVFDIACFLHSSPVGRCSSHMHRPRLALIETLLTLSSQRYGAPHGDRRFCIWLVAFTLIWPRTNGME